MTRAQSHVVGVALLLVASTVAIGTLTVGVGELVESRAASTDAERVADGLAEAVQPRETTGVRSRAVRFGGGSLRTVDRQVRISRNGTTVRSYDAGGLRYERGSQRVIVVCGAVLRQSGGSGWVVREPPIAGSERRRVLLVGLARLGDADTAVSGTSGTAVPIRTNASHGRESLGNGTFAVAIETGGAAALARHFEREGVPASVRDLDGDGVPSVRARFPGVRQGTLISHDLALEVGDG